MPTLRICLLLLGGALGVVSAPAPLARGADTVCSCGFTHSGPCADGHRPHVLRSDGTHADASDLAESPGVGEFRIRNGWSSTSTSSFRGRGDPVTLTWGFVRDGLNISGGVGEPASPSNLIEFLDTHVGDGTDVNVPGQTDQRGKSWFSVFQSAFDRWQAISGITFVYEPTDNGAAFPNSAGFAGLRADMRISGHLIDGEDGPNTLAYNYFPSFGDMVLDTGNPTFFGGSGRNYLALRNTLMHELGHGVGLNHLESNNSRQLMEPRIDLGFDGPQIDDIFAIQRNYGDAWEKAGGNNTLQTATTAGSLSLFSAWSVGADGDINSPDTRVEPVQTDFISIDDRSDVDFFRFTTSSPGLLDFRLKPVGPTYNEAAQAPANSDPLPQTPLNLSALGRLVLSIFNGEGSQVASGEAIVRGDTIVVPDLPVQAGETYYTRIGGFDSNVQLYRLDAALNPQPTEGVEFDLTTLPVQNQTEFSTTVDGVELTLAAAGSFASLSSNGEEGVGVISAEDPRRLPDAFGINGSLDTEEGLLITFNQAVRLENLQLRGLSVETDESVFLSAILGPDPFADLQGYSAPYTLAADGLSFSSPDWQSDIINLAFGVGGQSSLLVKAGTVLSLTSRNALAGGVTLAGITVSVAPEPAAWLLWIAAGLMVALRRDSFLRSLAEGRAPGPVRASDRSLTLG